jgi:hypothetical protein
MVGGQCEKCFLLNKEYSFANLQGCHGTSVTQSHQKVSCIKTATKKKNYDIEEKFVQQVHYWTKTKYWCLDKSQKILLLCGCSYWGFKIAKNELQHHL